MGMKKEFFQKVSRESIHDELKANGRLNKIRAFARAVLALSKEHPKDIPAVHLQKLISDFPELCGQFSEILKKESSEREEALKSALRKEIMN